VFRGKEVPRVLLEGNHEAIRKYRRREALRATWIRRPELLTNLSKEDLELLAEIGVHLPPSNKENLP
jgi:tRNA (guanine37-N1)-methyltransferase